MNAQRILLTVVALGVVTGMALHQWQLQRQLARLQNSAHAETPPGAAAASSAEDAAAKLRQAEARYHEAQTQLKIAELQLAGAQAQLAQLDQRVQQLEGGGRRTGIRTGFIPQGAMLTEGGLASPPGGPKRSWGPEQVVGEPDTLQAGDIPTAWAPLQQDGGEEWLKLDYENSVDIAEVRVRETHNPGAVSKITALRAPKALTRR